MNVEEIIKLHDLTFKLFLKREEIKEEVKRIAEEINKDYEGKEIVVIGVLDGAFMVLADLLKRLQIIVSLELIKLKSYQGTEGTGNVHKLLGLNSSLKDKDVLIVEDIVDKGTTLQYVRNLIKDHRPKSVKIATMLLKKDAYEGTYAIDYVGFAIPDKFVVGYGMDYNGLGRQLKHIYVLQE